MQNILRDQHLLQHPFYRDWMMGRITPDQLKDYACQYYRHVEAFPRYLSAIHSLSPHSLAQKILLENLNDEEGVTHGKPHPALWLQFAAGMGAAESAVKDSVPRAAIQNVVDTFFACARSSFAEGIGALYAYEYQVPEIAESKIEGLRGRYGIHEEATLEFFEVHRKADVYHREALDSLLDALSPEEKDLAEQAALRAGRALWDFLSDVHGNGRAQLATA